MDIKEAIIKRHSVRRYLDKEIDDCSVIIPTEAIRDEGTSYHYVKPNKTITVNK